jgi:hypothetical protein
LYNPVDALNNIEAELNPVNLKDVWEELWTELHHQDDVGIGSYRVVPQIARIGFNTFTAQLRTPNH